MYYIYHIPDKKIGVTRDLNKRVTDIQGYRPDEYEVLFATDDINKVSDMEIELQKFYGYKVDRQKYKDLYSQKLNKMKINVTEQTTTFPVPKQQLNNWLNDNIGLFWETAQGNFELNTQTINWILINSKKSMYNDERCFIYNKAYYQAFLADENLGQKELPRNTDQPFKYDFDKIRKWAEERGIYEKGDPKTQLIKLYEESGELSQAILKNDKAGIIDAIGDSIVVLTNLAHLVGTDVETCIGAAYDEISNRTGTMKNGTFVKDIL